MKFMHISDLHLGKKLHEMSLWKDQEFILKEIVRIAREQDVDGVIIAGDIYDKSIPPISAIELFDEFLVALVKEKRKIFIISGNHDSAERIAYGGRLMEGEGVYVSPVYQGNHSPIQIKDSYGIVNIYLLPFVKPGHVREAFPEEVIESYSDAVDVAIRHMSVNTEERNVLVTHQFVTGAMRCDSEDISVGGTDNVNAEVFRDFDYVALGHIHRAQKAGGRIIRYCGTPLKYSFSEVNHEKTVTIVELKEKIKKEEIQEIAIQESAIQESAIQESAIQESAIQESAIQESEIQESQIHNSEITIEEIPLHSLREMHVIKGTFATIHSTSIYETYPKDSIVQVTLTDEDEIVDAMSKLRIIFPNILRVDYDNERSRRNQRIESVGNVDEKTPFELFEMLYEKQHNGEMKEEQSAYMSKLIQSIWEGVHETD